MFILASGQNVQKRGHGSGQNAQLDFWAKCPEAGPWFWTKRPARLLGKMSRSGAMVLDKTPSSTSGQNVQKRGNDNCPTRLLGKMSRSGAMVLDKMSRSDGCREMRSGP